MKNKCVAILLIIALIFPCLAVHATFGDILGLQYEGDIKVLESIGVIKSDSNYYPQSYITRGDFIVMTAGLLGINAYYNVNDELTQSVDFLRTRGVLSEAEDGNYRCDEPITYAEALKMLVTALGYEEKAISLGGYPMGFTRVAANLKLTQSFNVVLDGYITRGAAASLLLKAGNTETAAVIYRTDNTSVASTGGDTLLYQELHIVKIEGIISANSATSLVDGNTVPLNTIKIGTNIIDIGNTNAKEYLGYCVDVYCVGDKSNRYTALAVIPTKSRNNVLRISSESDMSAEGSLSEFQIKYYTQEGKSKRIDISDYDVIYNGRALENFTLEDLNISEGELLLLDNDDDGDYDVLFIKSHETYIVDSVDKSEEKVYDKYGRTLDLSVNSDQIKIVCTDGTQGDISCISEGDILSVNKSRDNFVINVQIVKQFFTGEIEAIYPDDLICVNEAKYYISKNYKEISHSDKINPYVGLEARFSLDADGKIADISTDLSSWKYGYVVDVCSTGTFDDGIKLKMLKMDGKFEIMTNQNKVEIDGVMRNTSDISKNISSILSRGLVRYQADNGVIKCIDTAEQTSEEGDDTLNRISNVENATYNSNSNMFYNGNETLLGGKADTIVITVPVSESLFHDEILYTVGKMNTFGNGTKYNKLDAYDVNDAKIASVIVRNYDDKFGVGNTSSFVFVQKVGQSVNDENDVVEKLYGLSQNGTAYEKLTYNEGVIGDEIKAGDVVRIREKNGKLMTVQKDFDFENSYQDIFAFSSGDSSSKNTYYASLNIACGYIDYADSTHIVLTNDAHDKFVTFTIGSASILLGDTTVRDTVFRKITASELGNYVYSRNSSAKICVITKNGSVSVVAVRLK